MTSSQKIDTLKEVLVKTYHPSAIYLYGSHAWGKAGEESDMDVLVVVDQSKEKQYRRSVRGVRALRGLKINEDIIVHTRQEFEELSQDVSTLCHKIKKEGTILYEAL
ncbi:MAG: hypothetical protein AUK24_09870 [Syntrophaceae bacterium CG2_30_49_12]|nr:MAG: hypothetical protein AUK24_09870 [Syntrophaceae bacterium CG2_30_49_12]PIP07510.1 MAG: DNA polymerase III subunit beta [Syntrophobacterales bacterium CG23_combo_of_CG06-09_8_20_14_all_48_27]PJA49126.1 MAG: DNA polymerase III subunit beta [Syntrophobacterales bacterium CG_4_9_14_3_um_filter_49_8]